MSDKLLIKGFNDGYLLQQHNPELANELEEGFSDPSHPYADGFASGKAEFSKEQELQKSQHKESFFEKMRDQSISNSPDISKSKDEDLSL